MLEVEGEIPRLNMDLPRSHKHRFESDSFLADVALGACLGALPNTADGSQVLLLETVLIAINDNAVLEDLKTNQWLLAQLCGSGVVVVFGILKKFKNKSGTAVV